MYGEVVRGNMLTRSLPVARLAFARITPCFVQVGMLLRLLLPEILSPGGMLLLNGPVVALIEIGIV